MMLQVFFSIYVILSPVFLVAEHADIPPEDLREITGLFQKHPTLWGYFKHIIHVVDLMDAQPEADREVGRDLERIMQLLRPETKHFEVLIHFAAVCGFVEKAVSFGRKMLQIMGKTYITEHVIVIDGKLVDENACLYLLRSCMLSCTDNSSEFSLRLARSGYLKDLLEDVKHIQHLSDEARVSCHTTLNF